MNKNRHLAVCFIYSLNLQLSLVCYPQVHYIASHDETVPQSLSNKWLSGQMVKQIPDSSHSSFPNLKLDFSIDKQ